MSNHHRPFGDPDPFETDDLHREPTTDAPNDADALDAWLNEIAHSSGLPGPRSGSGQHRPDARIDDHDGTGDDASLIATAARFHRRIEAAHARDVRAAGPDPHLWETIMERTAAQQPAATPANPWTASPKRGKTARRRPAPQNVSPQTRQQAIRRQRVWNTVANIGLVAAILLAVFGAWRNADGPGLPSGSNGDEPTALASGVEHANAMDWPGIVSLTFAEVEDDPEAQYANTRAIVNILTGEMIRIGTRPTGYHDLNQHPGSPWLVAPYVGFQGEWSIIDLRTMEEKRLAEYETNQVTGGQLVIHDVTTSANGNDDTLAIANQFSNTYGGGIIDPNDEDLHELASSNVAMQYGPIINNDIPGSLLVLDGSLDDARWLSLPHEDQTYLDIQLSPDGEYLAMTSVDADFQSVERDPDGEVRGDILYSIMRLSDGAEIVQSPPTADQAEEYGTEMLWLADSSGLAYTHDGAVRVLPTDPAAEPHVLYEGADALRSLQPTTDPTRIIVSATPLNEMATADLRVGTPRVLSISTTGGETFELTGHVTHDLSDVDHLEPLTRFMVLVQFDETGAQTTTCHLVDVVTGAVLEELTTTVDVTGMGKGAIASTFDGEVTVASFGAQDIFVMQASAGEPMVSRLPSPEALGNPTGSVGVLVSPDGGAVFAGQTNGESRTVMATSLMDPSDTWTSVPAYPAFVPGTGD